MLLADDRCWAVISGESDASSWYHIWESITAIIDMCLQYGISGTETGLGRFQSQRSIVEMWSKRPLSTGERRKLTVELVHYYY